MPTTRTLSDQDMVDTLEDIAKNANNAAARIAAIKQLLAMESGAPADDGFAELDRDEVGQKRRMRTKASRPVG